MVYRFKAEILIENNIISKIKELPRNIGENIVL